MSRWTGVKLNGKQFKSGLNQENYLQSLTIYHVLFIRWSASSSRSLIGCQAKSTSSFQSSVCVLPKVHCFLIEPALFPVSFYELYVLPYRVQITEHVHKRFPALQWGERSRCSIKSTVFPHAVAKSLSYDHWAVIYVHIYASVQLIAFSHSLR